MIRTHVNREDRFYTNATIPVIRGKICEYFRNKNAEFLDDSENLIRIKMGSGWLIRLFGIFLVPEKYFPVIIETKMEAVNGKTSVLVKFEDNLGFGLRVTNMFDKYFEKLSREIGELLG